MVSHRFQFPAFDLDPLTRRLVLEGSDRSRRQFFAAAAILPWLICAVGAALGNRFGDRSDFREGCLDLMNALTGDGSPDLTSAPMTFMRDVGSQAGLVLLGASTCVIVWQWCVFDDVLVLSNSYSVLRFRDGGVTLEEGLKRSKRHFSRVERYWRLPVAAFVLITLFIVASVEARDGVFAVMAPDDVDLEKWRANVYDSWWAGNSNILGSTTYVAVSAFALYYIALQNIAGIAAARVVFASMSTFECTVQPRLELGGWRPVRHALTTIYVSILCHGLLLSILMITISTSRWGYATGLLAIFIVLNPVYLAASTASFAWPIRRARRAKFDELCARIARDPNDKSSADDLDRLERIGPLPFPIWRSIAVVLSLILPNALAIYTIAAM